MRKKVVIIGSGLAGTLLCNELAEHCDVTLLEAGHRESIRYPHITFIKKLFGGVKTFCMGGGGTTNLWHNGLIPINTDDLTPGPFRELINKSSHYIDQAAANLHWLDNPYSTEHRLVVERMNEIARQTGTFPDGVDCLFYPKKYKKLEPDTKANAFYCVKKINFIAGEQRIRSVECWIGRKKYSIDTDVVIISGGALASPLLINRVLTVLGSSGQKAGIGLADHPMGFIGKVKVNRQTADLIEKFSLLDRRNYQSRTIVRIKSSCGKFTCGVFFRPALTMTNELSIYKYKSLLGASSGLDRIKNMFSWRILHPDILAEISSHLFGAKIPGRIYNILIICEQKRGNSSVSYDRNGMVVDWSISEEELSLYRDIIRQLKEKLEKLADEINIETNITEDWLWSCAHHSGTVALGEGAEALVDSDLKLKASENVFVCDGSIIQEHSYANTGLTIGQLAMRLAQHIAHQ